MNIKINYEANDTGDKLVNELAEMNMFRYHLDLRRNHDYYEIILDDSGSLLQRTFNSDSAIANLDDPEYLPQILQINNLAYGHSEGETVNRIYEVLICDLRIMSVKTYIWGKGNETGKYIKENQNPKMIQMAQRVCHMTNLDFALITIGLTNKRKYKVQKINVSPILRAKELEDLLKYLTYLYEIDRISNKTEVKLGADPEFMLVNNKTGKLVPASQFFPREGLVGCDSIRIPNRQYRPIAEIRPHPEAAPEALLLNIKNALYKASEMAPYRNVKWVAGSQPVGSYSIGGHIHFGNLALSGALLRALDNYLALPIFMIEEQSAAVRRRKKYGFLGDYRLKDYGGFEYRTPGSWLVSPRITAGVLCLAKLVGTHYLELRDNYLNSVRAQSAFYEGNSSFFSNDFITLWEQIQKLSNYKRYETELQVFPDMILKEQKWDEKNDLRKAWKINIKTTLNYIGQTAAVSQNIGSGFNETDDRYGRVTRIQTSSYSSSSRVYNGFNPATPSRRSRSSNRVVTSGHVRNTIRVR